MHTLILVKLNIRHEWRGPGETRKATRTCSGKSGNDIRSSKISLLISDRFRHVDKALGVVVGGKGCDAGYVEIGKAIKGLELFT